MNEKISERVRKLLALAKSSNVHEAATAAEQANRLMLEHRLTLADVVAPTIAESHVLDERLMAVWRWGLFTACARSYYCDCVRVEETTTLGTIRVTGVVFGIADEIDAVKCLYDYLASKVEAMAEERRAKNFPAAIQDRIMNQVREDQSWKEGAVRAISEKLEKSRIMFERESAEAEKRAVKTWEAIRQYRAKTFSGASKPAMNERSDAEAFEKGFNTADKTLGVPSRARGRIGDS